MEDKSFWDELAKRLRQEQPQPFREEDWATVHRRLRDRRKRRSVAGRLWPVAAILFFTGNNLIWWLLSQQPESGPALTPSRYRPDTVYLIRERFLHDTVWKYIPQPAGSEPAFSGVRGVTQFTNPEKPAEQVVETAPRQPDTRSASSGPAGAPEHRALPVAFLPTTTPAGWTRLPPRIMTISGHKSGAPTPVRDMEIFLETGGGVGLFAAPGASKALTWQYGTGLYFLRDCWGVILGVHNFHAGENPEQTAAKLGLPDDCENCPAVGYPDQVRLQWLEFQFGPVYRLPWLKGKTNLYLSVSGRLRSRINQYRHFYFEQYGASPPIEVEDRYREKSGVYWNGWSGKLSAAHRLGSRLAVYGALEGRLPSGVTPRATPPSLGANVGLAWYFRP